MIRLYVKECSKYLRKLSTWMLLLIICVFGVSTSQEGSTTQLTQPVVNDDGLLLTGTSIEKDMARIRKEYAGYISEESLAKAIQDEKEERLKVLYTYNVEEDAMIHKYGTDWKTAYEKEPNTYLITTKEAENLKESNPIDYPFYVKNPTITLSTRMLVLNEYQNYAQLLLDTGHQDQEGQLGNHTFSTREMSTEEQKILQQMMNKQNGFYYDHYKGWEILVKSLANSRFLLAIFLIFLTSRCFNEDQSNRMIAIIKTTPYGKTKIAMVKLLSILTLSILVMLTYFAFMSIGIWLIYGLGNGNVNLSIFLNSPCPYTFKEAYLGGFLLLLSGCLTTALLSAALSVIFKKSYVSFAISLLILMLPTFLNANYKQLFPVEYMDFSGPYFYTHLFKFADQYVTLPPIIYCITLIILLFCCIGIPLAYRSYRITADA